MLPNTQAGDLAKRRAFQDGDGGELTGNPAKCRPSIDQLTRQFWVGKEEIKNNKYDLSASRYRQVEQDQINYEKPAVTMERLLALERVMEEEIRALGDLTLEDLTGF